MSVLRGERNVSFLLSYTIKKFYNSHIKDNPDVNMLTVPRDGEGIYGDGYIVYRDEAKAKHLLSVMAKHEGYLQDNTPEEAIENGEALEYDDNDIKEFTDSHYGVGSYDKIKMKY
jgi:hypothetical protein